MEPQAPTPGPRAAAWTAVIKQLLVTRPDDAPGLVVLLALTAGEADPAWARASLLELTEYLWELRDRHRSPGRTAEQFREWLWQTAQDLIVLGRA